ncbi:MAG: PIN domain-containing protein [Acidimicrobiia bacterium]
MIIADTSGLLAFFNRSEEAHDRVRAIVETERDPLVVSPYVVAELDYLIATRVGIDAELTVLNELASGAYLLAEFDRADLEKAIDVIAQYKDLGIGIADASLVVLAERFNTQTILTLDRRHFGVLRPLAGDGFDLRP